MQRKIRVLVGKPGLDGHDRGAKVVAAALRDAGMEVIYTGLHQTPAQVVEAAVQEDVDVVALSILSGAHMTLFPEVLGMMRERGIGDRLLSGGGIIPPEDMETLAKMGVGRLFGPGASTQDIAKYIRGWFEEQHGAAVAAPASRAAEKPHRAAAPQARAKSAAARPRRTSPAKRPAAARSGAAAKRKGAERAGSGASRKRR
jgi:methylmalonyl-CoA mutase C-terminal domain/subunit